MPFPGKHILQTLHVLYLFSLCFGLCKNRDEDNCRDEFREQVVLTGYMAFHTTMHTKHLHCGHISPTPDLTFIKLHSDTPSQP
jgi:hypothetical protein